MHDYADTFRRLTYETAMLVFLKKDGTVRLMLGTRNLNTVSLEYGFQGDKLGGHDKRCNIKNGNIAVYDLLLGDARSFHIDRLVDINWCGEVKDIESLNRVSTDFLKFKAGYEETQPMSITMDMI